MSTAPARPCTHPRCPHLVTASRPCPLHKRASPTQRGYSTAWANYSRAFLRVHRHCGDRPSDEPTGDSECRARGLLTPATETDHIRPHNNDARLLWSVENHQALCASCHGKKTRRENQVRR